MSAGRDDSKLTVNRDLTLLAPKFREAVEQAIADCKVRGYDAYVYEGYRSLELQQLYYARGRTIIPPTKTVTNAPSNLYSWHGYCLAVDVISIAHGWDKAGRSILVLIARQKTPEKMTALYSKYKESGLTETE